MSEHLDVNNESRIRHRAKRRGFYVLQTRGSEAERRQATGQGDLMLLAANRVVIFAATPGDIAACPDSRDATAARKSRKAK